MYDKTVRRRRAVLALLVVLSLLLLTAYFGESGGGSLHGVQRTFLTAVSPIQDGANKALKPVRDLFGWFGDTVHAKGQRDQLRKQIDQLRPELIAAQSEKRTYQQLLALYHLNRLGVSAYHPVTATVVGKSPNIWYSTVTIDKGSPDGVRVNDPVVNGEGLVGKVVAVEPDGAQVDLITDSSMGVSARIGASNATGIVQPKVGNPNDLLLQYLPANTHANKGEYVVTSGTVSGRDDSLYPPGLLIGQVTSENEESAYKSVNVHPIANLHNLDVVEVLTARAGGTAANLKTLIAALPVGQSSEVTAQGEQLASTGAGG
ncbi:MAG: rod shape-determining protein MreC [Solirubrobacteraceae bacterium]|nr:rod shape-determining protein MreC [Solirubrobacterales bacterium]MEA2215863.1 rod shape-determining protein MreC [Solirubrobacteraceae bacterium]